MEFFHAKIYWSGFGEIITNVVELPNPDTGVLTELNGEYAILQISLKDNEVLKLKKYLESVLAKTVNEDEFEEGMELVFYNGSQIDSWFNLKKFTIICEQLQINPTMFYYRYKHVLTLNME